MTKKKIAFVFIATKKYIFALSTMIVNLRETGNDYYDNIIIYHENFSQDDMKALIKLEPKIIFKKYTRKMYVSEHGEIIQEHEKKFIERYSHLTIVKYKTIENLKNYSKVLYIDLDMLILGDFSDIFKHKGVAWRNSGESFKEKFLKLSDLDNLKKYCNVNGDDIKNWSAPNSGLLYFSDDSLDFNYYLNAGREFVKFFKEYFCKGIDEITISFIFNYNKAKIVSLDKHTYNTVLSWFDKKTKIVHFVGAQKVWNNSLYQLLFPEWMEYYNESKEIVKYKDESVDYYAKESLREVLNLYTWNEIISNFIVPKGLKMEYSGDFSRVLLRFSSVIFYSLSFKLLKRKVVLELFIDDDSFDYSSFQNDSECLVNLNGDNKICIKYKREISYLDFEKQFNLFYKKTIATIKKHYYCTEPTGMRFNECDTKWFNRLKNITRINEYFPLIQKEKDLIGFFCGKDDCSRYFEAFMDAAQINYSKKPFYRCAYIMVIQNGEIMIEKTADKNKLLRYDSLLEFKNSKNKILRYLSIISEGHRFGLEKSRIIINNYDYSLNERGLNIVILNQKNGKIVDCFNVDTWGDKSLKINRGNNGEIIQIG